MPYSPLRPYRSHFDLRAWLNITWPCWQLRGQQAGVRVDLIAPSVLPRIWSSPTKVFQIVDSMVSTAIDRSLSDQRIELEVRLAEEAGEWIGWIVRDWAGGREEGWNIDHPIRQMAKELEGHIDISNHPGRSTACGLFLPSGILKGWLRRQGWRSSVFHLSWPEPSTHVNPDFDRDAWIERNVQFVGDRHGSLIPLGNRAYLLACDQPLEIQSFDAAIRRELTQDVSSSQGVESLDMRIEFLGPLEKFIQRLERRSTSEKNSTAENGDGEIEMAQYRIDSPAPHAIPHREMLPVSKGMSLVGARTRPRRANR